jgi:uncharacterized cupin superfamily protein
MAQAGKSGLSMPAFDPETVKGREGTGYPEPYRSSVGRRIKRALGEAAGLENFGVNLVRLEPGAWSSIRHWHTRRDEFVYVLEGELTLITEGGEQTLGPGMAAGFAAGSPDGHHLVNKSPEAAIYLEVGDRSPGDDVTYPDADLALKHGAESNTFTHNDGEPY